MGINVTVKNAMLDWYFGHLSTAYAPPEDFYLALVKTDETEVSGGNYARVHTDINDWSNAAAAVVDNTSKFTFPTPSGTWGSIKYCKIFDAATGGSEIGVAELTNVRTVTAASPAPEFPIGSIRILLLDSS